MKTYGGPKLLRNRLINWSKSKNNNSESSKSHINLVLKWKTNERTYSKEKTTKEETVTITYLQNFWN